MKLNTQEQIRRFELNAYLISLIISIILSSYPDYEVIQQIQNILKNNNIDINIIRTIISNIYFINFLTANRAETITDEYKELKSMYNEIIYNTAQLYKTVELSEPVSIFSTYVYMYRKGYFSHQNKFLYGSNMKDFSKLQGLDVIRGTGVCRSITSFLTDIYNEMNMHSYNVPVSVKIENLRKIKNLSVISLEEEEIETIFSKIIEIMSKYTKVPNHLITMVEHDNQNYIFDPTNDGFFQQKNLFKISISSDDEIFMRNHTFGIVSIIQNLQGVYPDGINIVKKYNQINKPTISIEEYEKRYLQALKFCLENDKLFQEFFLQNEKIINQIYTISEKQHSIIKRLIPII